MKLKKGHFVSFPVHLFVYKEENYLSKPYDSTEV